MKKNLILFITLVSTLCSANIASAGIKTICRNNTDYNIRFTLTSGWCGNKTIEVAPKSNGTIDIEGICRIYSVYAETDDKKMSVSRTIHLFMVYASPQEHHVDYAYEADGVHVKGIQITSPTKGMYGIPLR